MAILSKNITIPLDYDTDELRTELKAFGQTPGPITKTTKKLYIKKLMKCRQNMTNIPQTIENENSKKLIKCKDLGGTTTSQLTNLAIPLDYDTDELRAELKAFGQTPGPITKTTKKLYIKKLMKCRQNMTNIPQTKENGNSKKLIKCKDLGGTTTGQLTNLAIPLDYDTDELRAELKAFGQTPGPITKTTKKLYIKKLMKCRQNMTNIPQTKENGNSKKLIKCKDLGGTTTSQSKTPGPVAKRNNKLIKSKWNSINVPQTEENENKFSIELERTLKSEENFQHIKDYMKYEEQSEEYFNNNTNNIRLRGGYLKQCFVYMLIDPRISCNLPGESPFLNEYAAWKRFLKSIFYVGKGKAKRDQSHLKDALKICIKNVIVETDEQCNNISTKKQSSKVESKKIDRILNIWSAGKGVVCLKVFHNIMPVDAYTREAAIIDAIGKENLTNCIRGSYYGLSKTWNEEEKKYLGIALLFKAMRIYLAECEFQISSTDLKKRLGSITKLS